MQWDVVSDPIVLASSSPRRKELLESAGVPFEVLVSAAQEDELPGESPFDLVRRLALLKADIVARERAGAWVIGADTVVVIDGKALGKPRDDRHAVEMLRALSGRTHVVAGGLSIVSRRREIEWTETFYSEVTFYDLEREQIENYVRTGEPRDKAGAYAIQGIACQFVREVSGSYSNIVGLNIGALVNALREFNAIEIRTE